MVTERNRKQASMSEMIGPPTERMDVIHQEYNIVKNSFLKSNELSF